MIRRPLTLLLAAATVLLGVPTVVRLVGDQGSTPWVLLSVLVPLLSLPLLGLLVLQLLLRRRRIALVTAALVGLNLLWLGPQYWPDRVQVGEPLVLMTANLKFGEADPFALVALVRDRDVDVLTAQELTPEAVASLRGAGLEQELPFTELAAAAGPDGSGIWSRYPLEALPSWSTRFASPGAVVRMPTRQVVVRSVHAHPPVGTDAASYRADYAEMTSRLRGRTELPTVLAGDFNASADSSLFRALLGDHLRDASEVAGKGVQRTWAVHPGWVPLLALDHVVVDGRLDVRGTQVLDLPGSDHDAVVARLVIT